jgi:hypothetical protein
MLGHHVNSKYFDRNDLIDDENETHNAFDIGFISALEKIKFEKAAPWAPIIHCAFQNINICFTKLYSPILYNLNPFLIRKE